MIGYLAAVIVAMGMSLQQGTYMKSEQPIVDRDPNQMCLEAVSYTHLTLPTTD